MDLGEVRGSILEALAVECRGSFYYFLRTFWSAIIPEPLVDNWHIKYLCGELQTVADNVVHRRKKPYDLIINVPPSTTKTTIVTIMFPAWLWTQDPTLRIITNSYSDDLATEYAVKSRDIITCELYKRLFPDVRLRRDKSAKKSYENTRTGARYVTSTGGTITGKHAHVIISDDPLNPSQAASDAEREQANRHTATLATRTVDAEVTPVITIMQRLHEQDVTGYLLGVAAYPIRHICLPAELSDNVSPQEVRQYYVGGLLDPVRLSRETLQAKQRSLGTQAYAGQYGQRPYAEGGNIIHRDWFKIDTRSEQVVVSEASIYHAYVTFFLDTAYTENRGNDPTGIIATVFYNNRLIITSATKVYLEFPELCRWVASWTAEHGYGARSSIRIEPKASGLSLIQQLRKNTGLNVVQTPSPRDSKVVRATAASPAIECGRVSIIAGPWNKDYLDEMSGFPAAEHDEYVDVTGYALEYYDKADAQSRKAELDYFEKFIV